MYALSRAWAVALMIVALSFSPLLAAEVRTWTDLKGEQLTGTLTEITQDGKVKIISAGNTYTIEIEKFCDADQKYIQSQKKADTSLRPGPNRSDLKKYRTWTSASDETIKAKFVRVNEGKVVLLQGNKAHQVSLSELSQEDQQFLRATLTPEQYQELVENNTSANGMNGGVDTGPGMANQPGIIGGMADGSEMGRQMPNYRSIYAPPPGDDFGTRQKTIHDSMRSEIVREQEEARRRQEESRALAQQQENERRQRFEEQQRQRQQQMTSGPPSVASAPRPQMPPPQMPMSHQQQQSVGTCSNCHKTIYGDVGAGDHCPHCGVFFSEEVDEFGRTKKKVPVPWYYGAPIPIGLIVWGVIAVFRKMFSGDE